MGSEYEGSYKPVRSTRKGYSERVNLRNQIGLELVQVHVKGSIETKRSGDRGYNLSNQSVQVCKAWGGDAKVLLADIVDGFIIDLNYESILINWEALELTNRNLP